MTVAPPLPLFAYCQIYVNREKEMQEKEEREIVSEQNVLKKSIDLSENKSSDRSMKVQLPPTL